MPKFYDEKYLAQKLQIERRKFHREIKPLILRDFKKELQKINVENPDIGLDENDNICEILKTIQGLLKQN